MMTLGTSLDHETFVIYGQLSFFWSITTLLIYEIRFELDIWLFAWEGDMIGAVTKTVLIRASRPRQLHQLHLQSVAFVV